MLVLSRRRNESLVIDGQIEVRVLAINRNKVTIGISAPGDVEIRRAELTVRKEDPK